MTWAATADAADMSMGDSPKDCEEMGDEDDGRSIAEVATAGREIGGCKSHEMLDLASKSAHQRYTVNRTNSKVLNFSSA